MRTIERGCLVVGLLLALLHPAVIAQQRRGSLPVTIVTASAGAALGFDVVALSYHGGSGACPTVPGANCGSIGEAAVLAIGASILGAAAGGVIGGRLTGGRPNVLRSVAGAGLGFLLGGALLAGSRSRSAPAVIIAISVPEGVLSALVGR